MLTDSTELKSTGRPLPLLVMRARTPLMNKSEDWPRMLALDGAPKLVVVNALDVSFEKSRTSVIEMSVSCWREMMVTLRGTSTMLSSVPNTELNGRAVGRICRSIGTSLTSNLLIVTTSEPALAGAVCAVSGDSAARPARVKAATVTRWVGVVVGITKRD